MHDDVRGYRHAIHVTFDGAADSSRVTNNPVNRRGLVKTVVSNSTFDRGVFRRPTLSRSTCSRIGQRLGLAPQAGFEPATLRLTATPFNTTGNNSRQSQRISLGKSSA